MCDTLKLGEIAITSLRNIFDQKKLNFADTLVLSHTGKETMGYLYQKIDKNRLISHRKPAWVEPGIVEHPPRSPDLNTADFMSK